MYQSSTFSRGESPVSVIGAGIAGAWQALLFAQAGRQVTLHERGDAAMLQSASHWAGGMLAPYCEAEVSEPLIVRLGLRSLDLWREHLPQTPFNGSLVLAHPRDRADFERFAKMTSGHRRLDAASIRALEPSLEERFRDGLFYPDEGHVEPRRVLPQLHARISEAGGTIRFNSDVKPDDADGIAIDCRGLAARDTEPQLRGVKGEMVIVETGEIELARPVRLIHPRWPLYIIPRADHQFMIGATSVEAEDRGISVRSALELLSAAYAVHPAFAEARIVEFGSGLRPAFPDNLPRIAIDGGRIAVNGLYRHGFLLAPALAELTLGYVERGVIDNEVMQCA
ncbi:MAG: FAD-dependent oxidoreductase [Bradyrhizobium sp.]|uniref:FAD-dependent oxidoreductase n=1 Tax=Bradyrhizobium sp. TaxID=376 RepID=UPI001C283489|nr:FAD-dependent oxidoreductase [Bradyrhizobium sp.]MBU6462027.1 FAD-dependent oxidoreductase [Pseudomonadota bacterium]MDE2066476.1 FAD-dependent oxidoreductase [Bradyrhizobium sp.]MDE2242859.1 FAD-dependent oxidoreductase [Bradyrhizobium sp.]MDE2468500.1 FAD-dependent oxidoreductase [Bradyrhizobium sp.]